MENKNREGQERFNYLLQTRAERGRRAAEYNAKKKAEKAAAKNIFSNIKTSKSAKRNHKDEKYN